MNRLLQRLALLLLFTPLAGHTADQGLPHILRIGTAANYAPLSFMKDSEFQGMEADMAKEITRRMKVSSRIVVMPWKELIPALESGKIDVIMGGMSITDERSREVLFTEPYMKVGQMALIRTSELAKWTRPGMLFRPGVHVGVVEGTTGEHFVRSEMAQADIRTYPDTDSAAKALLDGKIDVFIHDAPTVWRLTATSATMNPDLFGIYRPLTDEYLAWAVRKDDRTLADALNRQLDAMRRDGTLNHINRRWIPVTVKVGQ